MADDKETLVTISANFLRNEMLVKQWAFEFIMAHDLKDEWLRFLARKGDLSTTSEQAKG